MSKNHIGHIYFPILLLLAVLCLTGRFGIASTGSNSAADEAVAVKTAWSADGARPGESILLAVVVDIKAGFQHYPLHSGR